MDFIDRIKAAVANQFPFEDEEDFDAWVARARLENSGMRAMLAATLADVSRQVRSEDARRKRAWIAAARLAFVPSRRSACFVCGKFESVAQAHHLIPLSEQYDNGFRAANHTHEWLCPTHHAILHLWIDEAVSDQHRGRRAVGTFIDLEVARNGLTVRSRLSSTIPCCISSDQSVSQSA